MVWTDARGVFAKRVTPLGVVLDVEPIAVHSGLEFGADVAWNGNAFLVVWPESRRIVGAFITPAGDVTQPRALMEEPPALEYASEPRLAWDGQEFLLVWDEMYPGAIIVPSPPWPLGIRGVRLSAAGDVIDRTPMHINDAGAMPRIATSGADFAVIGASLSAPGVRTVTILRPGGASLVVSDPIPVLRWTNRASDYEVAWNGLEYVIAYTYGLVAFPPDSVPVDWIGTVRLSRSGELSSRMYTQASQSDGVTLATTADGRVVAGSRVCLPQAGGWRIKAFLESDFTGLPAPPARLTVTATAVGADLDVSWMPPAQPVDAYQIIACVSPQQCNVFLAPADMHAVRLTNWGDATTVIVEGVNAAGSASAPIALPLPPRRRAAR